MDNALFPSIILSDPFAKVQHMQLLNNAAIIQYTCVPNRKTRTEMFQYDTVYRYTPNMIHQPIPW